MKIEEYIQNLSAHGTRTFTSGEVKAALGKSDKATWSAIERLKAKGTLASPAKGFYVIIPPEYRILKCLPPELFISSLMSFWNKSYYISLLSAAMYLGAAHHQPQVFQVMMEEYHPKISCGKVRIEFAKKKNLSATPLQTIKTTAGNINISTPESTAIDLISYPGKCGGLNNILTILEELSEILKPFPLISLLENTREKTSFQRLGYLLERIGNLELASLLYERLKLVPFKMIPLDPSLPIKGAKRDAKWKIALNTELESEL